MKPRVHYLMDLLMMGGMLTFVAYICGDNPAMGLLAMLLFAVFGVLLIFQIRKMWKERKK